MSTKIYDGVRFPKRRLPEFIRVMHDGGRRRIYRQAREVVNAWVPDAPALLAVTKEHREKNAEHEEQPTRCCRVQLTLSLVREAGMGSERNPFDMESGWNIWLPYKGPWALASPWGDSRRLPKRPSWVEEFGYWNNTDQPDHMTDRQWRARGRAWQVAVEPDTWEHRLRLIVFEVDKQSGHGLDTSWLELALLYGLGRPK